MADLLVGGQLLLRHGGGVVLRNLPHPVLLAVFEAKSGLQLRLDAGTVEGKGVDAVPTGQGGRPKVDVALVNHALGLVEQEVLEVILDLRGGGADLR
jgi:hypothetical protein